MRKLFGIMLVLLIVFESCKAAGQMPVTKNEVEDRSGVLLALQSHRFLVNLELSDDQFLKLKALTGSGDDSKGNIKVGWVESGIVKVNGKAKRAVFQGLEDYLSMAKKLNDAYLGDFASLYISEEGADDQPDYSEMVSNLTELMAGCTQVRFQPTYKVAAKARANAKEFLEILEIGQIVELFQNHLTETPLEIFESILDSDASGLEWIAEKNQLMAAILEYLDLDSAQSESIRKELVILFNEIEPFKKQVPILSGIEKKKILDSGKKVMADFGKEIPIVEELINDLIESDSINEIWVLEKNKTLRNFNAILGINVQNDVKPAVNNDVKKGVGKNQDKTVSPNLDKKQKKETREAFMIQMGKVFSEIEVFKKAPLEIDAVKRKEIITQATKILVSKENKMIQLQKRVESIIAYQFSNPLFGSVVQEYTSIIDENKK